MPKDKSFSFLGSALCVWVSAAKIAMLKLPLCLYDRYSARQGTRVRYAIVKISASSAETFSFRYRDRVTIEREVHLFKGRAITPYASAEIFYDERVSPSAFSNH